MQIGSNILTRKVNFEVWIFFSSKTSVRRKQTFNLILFTFNFNSELNFQVVGGGELDVDVGIAGPSRQIIYKQLRKEFDTVHFNSTVSGNNKQ